MTMPTVRSRFRPRVGRSLPSPRPGSGLGKICVVLGFVGRPVEVGALDGVGLAEVLEKLIVARTPDWFNSGSVQALATR